MSIKKDYEIELFNKFKENNDLEAKKELLKSLTPLITSQANKFINSGLPPLAIKLEGIRLSSGAIDTYDPSKAQLNTHIINNLKKLSRFVTNYQNVGHIPEPRALMIGKYNTIYSNLNEDKGREPTAEELADSMQVPITEIERLQTELRKDLSLNLVDDENDSDDGTGFYQYISGDQNPKQKEAIEFVYFDSDPVEKKILEWTLGLYGNPILSTKDILTKLKLSDLELKKIKEKLAKEISELSQ